MSSNGITITFKGEIGDIFRRLRNTGHVEVGVIGKGKKTKKDEVSVAYYGSVHEFGHPPSGIPMRSFLRRPLKRFLPKYMKEHMKAIIKNIEAGKEEEVLNKLGTQAKNIVIEAFKTHGAYGEWPKLKPETIERKTKRGRKGDAILIDSGALRQSIDYRVVFKENRK